MAGTAGDANCPVVGGVAVEPGVAGVAAVG